MSVKFQFVTVALFVVSIFSARMSQASVWQTTVGDWATATNWDTNPTIPNSVTAIADFSQSNVNGNDRVGVNGNFTVNKLIFGDTNTGTVGTWILDEDAATDSLTIGGVSPEIDVQSSVSGKGQIDTLDVFVAGGVTVTKKGPGTLHFQRATMAGFNGNLVVEAGNFQAGRLNDSNYDNVLPNGTITFAGAGNGSFLLNSSQNLSINEDLILAGGGTATFTLRNGSNDSNTFNGVISGAGNLILANTGNGDFHQFAGANTYTGDTTILDDNELRVLSTASIMMDINSVGDSTEFLGEAAATGAAGILNLDTTMTLDITDVTGGGTWNLVDFANLAVTYGANFSVEFQGGGTFVEGPAGVWTSDEWTFTESTGILELPASGTAPEPSTFVLLALAAITLGNVRRRHAR